MTEPECPELLQKGIEEEVYTGTRQGDVVGMSHEIAADLQGFVTEPDARNSEYALPPIRCYQELGHSILCARRTLRRYLKKRGDYTLLPGSSLALGDTSVFIRSNPNNPYHDYIEKTYGTKVVTASTHINIGVENPEELIRAYRVLRAEACLYLALSAASPFLDGQVTGVHSIRWQTFPKTPPRVPFFRDHAHYIDWVDAQLADGTMNNVRHLWSSVRPNGIGAPREIQRVELRICERVDNVRHLMGLIALTESRVQQVLTDPSLDPLTVRSEADLIDWVAANEAACARDSLDATVTRWDTGEAVSVRSWVHEQVVAAKVTATPLDYADHLTSIREILEDGNPAQQWLAQQAAGASVHDVYRQAIAETEAREAALTF